MNFTQEDLYYLGIAQSQFVQFAHSTETWDEFILRMSRYADDKIGEIIGPEEYERYFPDGDMPEREKTAMMKCSMFFTAYYMFISNQDFLDDLTKSQSSHGRSMTKEQSNKQALRFYFKGRTELVKLGYDI